MTHDGNSPALLTQSRSRAYHIISIFATQPEYIPRIRCCDYVSLEG
jgi:hypothetical protein